MSDSVVSGDESERRGLEAQEASYPARTDGSGDEGADDTTSWAAHPQWRDHTLGP